jgi:alanine-glyoxylate transaminase / serine-glyoxylate transaminase / serine-pyruvate transaminase
LAEQFAELRPTARILLGPGPSNVHPRVMKAMMSPVIGHLDPDFVKVMEDLKRLQRAVFRTENEMTFPASGTGSSGMEMIAANLIEDGDQVIVGVNGAFGARFADCAERQGARVHKLEAEWGRIIEPDAVNQALTKVPNPKLVVIVHAETSTGVHQPVEEISALTHARGALLVVDAVTSLACVPLETDQWGIDACFSCTQKGLSAPPGLAPVTFSARAMEAIRRRRSKCRSWYLDVAAIGSYWGSERVYHHTAPITMIYALYEALRVVMEEGLEERWLRHRRNAAALHAGLDAIGLKLVAQEGHRLPQLTTVAVPPGVDEAKVRAELLQQFNIEIAAGLGPLRGKVWRIGLMGESSCRENVTLLLGALEQILAGAGFELSRGKGLAAAQAAYATG